QRRRQLLRIVQPAQAPGKTVADPLDRQDHRGGNRRSGEGSATRLIDAGDRVNPDSKQPSLEMKAGAPGRTHAQPDIEFRLREQDPAREWGWLKAAAKVVG